MPALLLEWDPRVHCRPSGVNHLVIQNTTIIHYLLLMYCFCIVPSLLQGVSYSRVTDSSVYTVSVPVKQDLSVARGVLSQFYSSIVKYDDSSVRQSLRYDTGLGSASYCVDESDDRSVGSLYTFSFTQLGK